MIRCIPGYLHEYYPHPTVPWVLWACPYTGIRVHSCRNTRFRARVPAQPIYHTRHVLKVLQGSYAAILQKDSLRILPDRVLLGISAGHLGNYGSARDMVNRSVISSPTLPTSSEKGSIPCLDRTGIRFTFRYGSVCQPKIPPFEVYPIEHNLACF